MELKTLTKFLQWGLKEELDRSEQKRIYLTNTICITFGLFILPYTALYAFLRLYGIAILTFGVSLSLFGVLLLHRAGYTRLGRWLLPLIGYIDLTIILSEFGATSGIHLTTFILLNLPLILFGAGMLAPLLLNVAATILLYLYSYFYQSSSSLPIFYQHLLHIIFATTIFISIFWIFYQTVKTNENYEDELLQANQRQNDFLTSISHELRTPLNAIIGYSELLEEDAEEDSLNPQEVLADSRRILSSARHLLTLINDLLDLSKIDAGQLKIIREKIVLDEFCKQIAQLMLPLVQAQHNQFHLDLNTDLREIEVDPTKLRQCLLNLLSNAAKFTETGEIHLRVSHTSAPSQNPGVPKYWLHFVVEDTGIGMSPESLEKMFSPYMQFHHPNPNHKGTGLGMVITQKLCRLMGGELSVESEEGRGTRCTMKIPVALS